MSNSTNSILFRSRNYGGHLNQSWVKNHLPRYQLAYENAEWIKTRVLPFGPPGSKNEAPPPARSTSALHTKNNFEWLKLLNYLKMQKVLLHSSSGKFLQGGSFTPAVTDLAFSTIALQSRLAVYSVKGVAGFKLAPKALLGAKATLRNLKKDEFFYKLYFLAASNSSTGPVPLIESGPAGGDYAKTTTTTRGKPVLSFSVKNVFIFNELDSLDYDSFSSMPGLEVQFLFAKEL